MAANRSTKTFPAEVQSAIALLDPTANADKLTADERLGRVQALHSLVAFALASKSPPRRLIRTLAPLSDTLLSYAHTGAVHAIREDDPNWVQSGLVALALENLRGDRRDTLVILSLLGHSGRKLAAPLDAMVERAAAVAEEDCRELLLGFFRRDLPEQSIALMGYREGKGKQGFRYVQTF